MQYLVLCNAAMATSFAVEVSLSPALVLSFLIFSDDIIIIIIIIYNLYRGKAPVTRSDFQGGPLRVKIKYTKAKNIQYN